MDLPDFGEQFFARNPFPADHPLHDEYKELVRRGARERLELIARTRLPAADPVPVFTSYFEQLFDIRARVDGAFLATDDDVAMYRQQLSSVADGLLTWVGTNLPPAYHERLRTGLRTGLYQRAAHWLSVATLQVDRFRLAGGLVQRTSPTDSAGLSVTWSDVEIVAISDFSIQMSVAGRRFQSADFDELGLGDARGRTGKKPKRAWQMLLLFAKKRGLVPVSRGAGKAVMEKRVQELRAKLRSYVRSKGFAELAGGDDPIPFIRGQGYETQFKVSTPKASSE